VAHIWDVKSHIWSTIWLTLQRCETGSDVRVGVGRRRRWSDEAKGRIVAESFAAGAVVSEVARRHDISPQHLFAWRKAARAGLLSLPADDAPMFVPVVMKHRQDGVTTQRRRVRGSRRSVAWWFVRRTGSIWCGCGVCCGR
jgi:transposase